MSSSLWKHGVRELLRTHAYLQAASMQRGLERDNAYSLDSYLLSHVLVQTRLDTAQETYATGGVTTKDRMHRHKDVCSNTCEHCGELDTAEHRLYTCPITDHVRKDAEWDVLDSHRIEQQ
eukprot:1549518-Amphidinium_carterae.1